MSGYTMLLVELVLLPTIIGIGLLFALDLWYT